MKILDTPDVGVILDEMLRRGYLCPTSKMSGFPTSDQEEVGSIKWWILQRGEERMLVIQPTYGGKQALIIFDPDDKALADAKEDPWIVWNDIRIRP